MKLIGSVTRCLLDDADFFGGQAVELVDELVDLFIGCVDLALNQRFFLVGLSNHVGSQVTTPSTNVC